MSHSLRLLRTLAAILLAATLASPAAAAVWRVKAGESIQAAIDRAELGDTIEIERARYFGHLLVDKPLTLRGIDRPTIDGELKENTISVKAENVTIDGLIVANSGGDTLYQHAGIYIYPGSHKAVVRNCDFSYTLFGLWIEKADDVLIENNLITGKRDFDSPKRGNGIQLYNTQRARIIGNNVSFVRDAIYVDVSHDAIFRGNKLHHSRYGTHYMTSYRNIWEDNETWYNRGGLALMEVRDQIVRNNRAWGNSDHGIMLRTIQDAVIENNVVAGNQRGFFIYDAEYNEIRGNQVIDNVVGIHLWAGSKNNKVEGNDFIANREQIRYVAARDMIWGAEEGNYWSNYLGWDRNGDGAGDVQY
ncbi:nitrous oxide reductase family maturation protein NosD, partial [Thauera sp.]